MTVDAALSLRQQNDHDALPLNWSYSENTPHDMVMEAFLAGNSKENTFLGLSPQMHFDFEALPLHAPTGDFITLPVRSGDVAIGMLLISLKERAVSSMVTK